MTPEHVPNLMPDNSHACDTMPPVTVAFNMQDGSPEAEPQMRPRALCSATWLNSPQAARLQKAKGSVITEARHTVQAIATLLTTAKRCWDQIIVVEDALHLCAHNTEQG